MAILPGSICVDLDAGQLFRRAWESKFLRFSRFPFNVIDSGIKPAHKF
jgi:hypothetical protein